MTDGRARRRHPSGRDVASSESGSVHDSQAEPCRRAAPGGGWRVRVEIPEQEEQR